MPLISEQVDSPVGSAFRNAKSSPTVLRTIDLSAPGAPQVDPLQQVRAFAYQLTPAAQTETARLVEQARAASSDVAPEGDDWAGLTVDELDALTDRYNAMADEFDAAADIDEAANLTADREEVVGMTRRMRTENGTIVDVDQQGRIVPPARNAVDDYAAAQRRTAARYGSISLANESDRGDAPNDWDETERRAAGELVEPSAERDTFVQDWARENSHLIRHGSTGIDGLAAPGRPMRAGVGFNADGSRGYHDQQPANGYETADRQFCRPGESDVQRLNRNAIDDAPARHYAKLEAQEYVRRAGL